MSRDDDTARRAELNAPATQLVSDRDAYLGQREHDVGRRIADDQVELFISSDVASALQGEFQQHASEFIALHDVGTRASLRLLGSLASAAAAPVQRLTVRRQGHGMALAVLQFVEVAMSDASQVRVYSTDIEADGLTRQKLVPLLLSRSRLGALLIGELPPHAMTSALASLRESLARGPWPNREMLVVPVGASTALAAQATWLTGESGVQIHVTPSAPKPKQAWAYVAGAWNRSHGQEASARLMQTALECAVARPAQPEGDAPTEPMGLGAFNPPAPPGRTGAATAMAVNNSAAASAVPLWQPFTDRCSAIKGVVACCVFNADALRTLAHTGSPADAARMAKHGATLLAQMQVSARALGLESAPTEAVICVGAHYLLLRVVDGHAGVVVHLLLRADQTTPSQARADLDRVAPPAQ